MPALHAKNKLPLSQDGFWREGLNTESPHDEGGGNENLGRIEARDEIAGITFPSLAMIVSIT